MGLIRTAILGAIGYAGYKYYKNQKHDAHAAFASGQPAPSRAGNNPVRDAGAEAMRDKPATWSKTDEGLDESFPASDPVGSY